MDVDITWEEFIRRTDPAVDPKVVKKKFAMMVIHFMLLYYKQRVPPKRD